MSGITFISVSIHRKHLSYACSLECLRIQALILKVPSLVQAPPELGGGRCVNSLGSPKGSASPSQGHGGIMTMGLEVSEDCQWAFLLWPRPFLHLSPPISPSVQIYTRPRVFCQLCWWGGRTKEALLWRTHGKEGSTIIVAEEWVHNRGQADRCKMPQLQPILSQSTGLNLPALGSAASPEPRNIPRSEQVGLSTLQSSFRDSGNPSWHE